MLFNTLSARYRLLILFMKFFGNITTFSSQHTKFVVIYSCSLAIQAQASASAKALWCMVRS